MDPLRWQRPGERPTNTITPFGPWTFLEPGSEEAIKLRLISVWAPASELLALHGEAVGAQGERCPKIAGERRTCGSIYALIAPRP